MHLLLYAHTTRETILYIDINYYILLCIHSCFAHSEFVERRKMLPATLLEVKGEALYAVPWNKEEFLENVSKYDAYYRAGYCGPVNDWTIVEFMAVDVEFDNVRTQRIMPETWDTYYERWCDAYLIVLHGEHIFQGMPYIPHDVYMRFSDEKRELLETRPTRGN